MAQRGLAVKVGAQPINWCNDDFRDLGASISLDQCLAEMREAGYEGTELGHRFPEDPAAIVDALAARLRAAGAEVVIVAECTGAIHPDGSRPLRFAPGADLLDEAAWARV